MKKSLPICNHQLPSMQTSHCGAPTSLLADTLVYQNWPFWLSGTDARPICFIFSAWILVGDDARRVLLGFDHAWSSLKVL